jgi:ribonuclease Z
MPRFAIPVILLLLLRLSTATTALAGDESRRDFYFPNTEKLAENEMRVIALGTGNPNFRRAQASPSWLVELGNGDKFLFDVGTGSLGNLASLEIPFYHLNKVFLSHLHIDHMGDLDALFIGGWVANRIRPLEVWGPSAKEEQYGTQYAIDRLREMYSWDIAGRKGNMPSSGGVIIAHEFDYSKVQTVYQQNDVIIRSWPAIHTIDGPVSFGLEWKGLKFVFSGDTAPNRWFLEEAKNADMLIHECYFTVDQLITKKDYDPKRAKMVGTVVHTSPTACGKIFSSLKPRVAVAYHVFTDFDIAPSLIADIRKTYTGRLSLADDMMVWNIAPDRISVRMTVSPDEAWPAKPPQPAGPPNRSELIPQSDWLKDGRLYLD